MQENDLEMLIIELLYRIRELLTHILCPLSAIKDWTYRPQKRIYLAQNSAFIFYYFFPE